VKIIAIVAFLALANGCVTASSNPDNTYESIEGNTQSSSALSESDIPKTVFETVSPAVVRLDVDSCGVSSVGTGFSISEELVVTVAHNVAEATAILVRNGSEIAMAEVIGIDESRDMALLKTDVPIGDSFLSLDGPEPLAGDELWLFGFPLGLDLTVTRGIVSNADVELSERPLVRFVQIDAAANPGNSGGPAVDAKGNVIGILHGGLEEFEGLNFAIKTSSLKRLLESWISEPQTHTKVCDGSEVAEEALPQTTLGTVASPSSAPTSTYPPGPDNEPEVRNFGPTFWSTSLHGPDSSRYRYTVELFDADIPEATSIQLSYGDGNECRLLNRVLSLEGASLVLWYDCDDGQSGQYPMRLRFRDIAGFSYNLSLGSQVIPYPRPADS